MVEAVQLTPSQSLGTRYQRRRSAQSFRCVTPTGDNPVRSRFFRQPHDCHEEDHMGRRIISLVTALVAFLAGTQVYPSPAAATRPDEIYSF
jgi:hypothetical protein